MKISPSSHKGSEFRYAVIRQFSRGDERINGIMSDIESEIRLFADDCVCYREIKDIEDALKLQKDIDRLGILGQEMGYEILNSQMQHDAADKEA